MDVYDPVLGEAELALLRARGCGAPERNEEGRRSVATQERGLTLFFMPHCGRQLYANVLEANWGPEPLSRLVVVVVVMASNPNPIPDPNPDPNPNPSPNPDPNSNLTLTLIRRLPSMML